MMNEAHSSGTWMKWPFLRRILWHVLIVAILAPFLACLLFFVTTHFDDIRSGDPGSVIPRCGGAMLFGAPIILLFAAVSFIPLFELAKIRERRNRAIGFSLMGALLGFLAGMWAVESDLGNPRSWVLVLEAVFVGTLCGYLDSLAWRDDNRHAKGT